MINNIEAKIEHVRVARRTLIDTGGAGGSGVYIGDGIGLTAATGMPEFAVAGLLIVSILTGMSAFTIWWTNYLVAKVEKNDQQQVN